MATIKKEDEIKFIHNLFNDYLSHIEDAIKFFSGGNWNKYRDVGLLSRYEVEKERCNNVLYTLNRIINNYFNGAYTPEQLADSVFAKRLVQNAKDAFAQLKQNQDFQFIMSNIAHNSYFNGDWNEQDFIMQAYNNPDYLAERCLDGDITKEKYFFYVNIADALRGDPDFLEYNGLNVKTK